MNELCLPSNPNPNSWIKLIAHDSKKAELINFKLCSLTDTHKTSINNF